jgi:hypothetical protein
VIAPRAAAVLFVAGGLGLALCDQIHVHSGVLDYDTGGVLFDQAWWVPLQFGVAALAIVAAAVPFAHRRDRPRPRDLATGIAWFVGAYAASGVFDAYPWALAAGLLALFGWRVALADHPDVLVVYALLLAVAGTGAEALLSAAGTFAYSDPDFLGVPVWLPGLYLNGAPLALAIAGRLAGDGAATVGPDAARAPLHAG